MPSRRHPSNRHVVSLLPFACLAILSTALVSTLPAAAQGPPPALVEMAPVERHTFQEQLTLVGRTEARAESRIVAEVSGRVASVDAGEGRPIRRGQPLVTIDCRRLALAIEAKTAEAAQAAAAADLAKKELERAQELVETSVFPQRNLDSAESEATRASERHRQLEAERAQLEHDLENCSIRAPFDGVTVRKLVDIGEWVDPGTAVYELLDLSRVKVTVDLPERRFGEVEKGSRATVLAESAGGEVELEGRITGIAPRASETTHTFPVLITVDNAAGRLGSGMLVRAVLDLAGTFDSLAVSKDAVVRQGDRTMVYTVADGVARALPVEVRASDGSRVAVAGEGLEEGLPVVVRGNERLFPGSPARTTGEDGAETPASGGGA